MTVWSPYAAEEGWLVARRVIHEEWAGLGLLPGGPWQRVLPAEYYCGEECADAGAALVMDAARRENTAVAEGRVRGRV